MDGSFVRQQVSNFTRRHRHPAHIFLTWEQCQVKRPKVLSFGCSKGDECLDLLEMWPNAQIFGTDIHPGILKKAKARYESLGLTFFPSEMSEFFAHGPFDVIFAMNVFCRNPETLDVDHIADIYPFAEFDAAITNLTKFLAPGGLLTLYNTNYFFQDCTVYDQFEPVAQYKNNGFIERSLPSGQRATRLVCTWQGQDYSGPEWREIQKQHGGDGPGGASSRHDWRSTDYIDNRRNVADFCWRKIA